MWPTGWRTLTQQPHQYSDHGLKHILSPTMTADSTLPDGYTDTALHRIGRIDAHGLLRVFSATFKAYQAATSRPASYTDVTDVVVCGSFLTTNFDTGRSDLDVILVCDQPPTDAQQDTFWQYANDHTWTQQTAQDCVDMPVSRVDTCGLVGKSHIHTQVWTSEDEPLYPLTGTVQLPPDSSQ